MRHAPGWVGHAQRIAKPFAQQSALTILLDLPVSAMAVTVWLRA
ncbi:hypothetical protein AB0I10_32305 [Streptomyces sp. NPDC050636]